MHAGNWYGLIRKKTYLGVSRCNRQKQLVSEAPINNYQIISHDRSWAPLGISTHQKELCSIKYSKCLEMVLSTNPQNCIFLCYQEIYCRTVCSVCSYGRLPQVWPHPPSLTAPVTNTSRYRHDRVHVRSSKR